MSEQDITILPRVRTPTNQFGRLYYYQGNFFKPLAIHSGEVGRVSGAIRNFMRENRDLITRDRAHPEYKTLVELFDNQMRVAQ